ncbi:hypothetical protein JQ615_14810 [Bradyrhizobium jicamae]|uniref:Uncharacterized protein n=1 Tax=Bradyrhizobium jicamae TaxID=280332 RepID=A0ABS5FIP4_9BRAD|nr:hypothetical protein [Bradyrhizobium jicamae]MBR0796663.1 hypothetical protein [Bradyrhizobium jicamae]
MRRIATQLFTDIGTCQRLHKEIPGTRMSNRSAIFAAALAAGMLGAANLAAAQTAAGTAEKTADNCQPAPKGSAPAGSHWYFHLDRATQKKCWYLGEAKNKAAKAAAAQQPAAPAPDATAADDTSPQAQPQPQPQQTQSQPQPQPQPAMRKSVADAHAEVVSPPAAAAPAAAPDASQASNPAADANAPADPNAPSSSVTARWFDASSMGASNGTRLATPTPAPAATQADATQTDAPAPAPAAAAQASTDRPSSSTQMLLIVMIGALALAGLVSALVVRLTRTRTKAYEIDNEWHAPWDSLSRERAPPVAPKRERPTRAFPGRVDAGSREENASKPKPGLAFEFRLNGNGSRLSEMPPRRAEPPMPRREGVRDFEKSEEDSRQIAEMLQRLARSAAS